LQKYTPSRTQLRQSRTLGFLGNLIHDNRLWQLNRRSVANAFALGMFWMWVPVPMQMLFAALFAIPCRANLPVAIALVWISNPITLPPMFLCAYFVGAWVLGRDMRAVEFDISLQWLSGTLLQIWEPFLLGCALLAILCAGLGYVAIQVTWRFCIQHAIQRRRKRKARQAI